jgi:hypothetical protein
MKIVQITAVQSKSDRADHIVYGLDENGEMWRSDNGHNSWEYMGGLPKECVVLPDVIGVFEPSDTDIIKACGDYMVYEWGYDRNDLHPDTGIRHRLMTEFKWILKRIKEAQK